MSFINYLRESNVSKYTNIMSNEDVIRELLKQSKDEAAKKLAERPNSIKAIADVFQSITTEAVTINEMLESIYINYCSQSETKENAKEVLDDLSSFITIIHDDGENFISEKTDNVWAHKLKKDDSGAQDSEGPFITKLKDIHKYQTPFVSFKKLADNNTVSGKYEHQSKYGLLSKEEIKKIRDAEGEALQRQIYNIHEICHAKADAVRFKKQGATEINRRNLINATNENNICAASKAKPSLAYVLVDHPDLRIGTRNSLELATFFNLLSTVELSKCQPYLDAVFVLPLNIESKSSTKIFKTASITQFFDGTPTSFNSTTDVYKRLEASFKRKVGSGKTEKIQDAVGTNMSAFTMPQTINNFNEKFIGHNESAEFNTDMRFARQNTVHDITRPFLTIKNFSIDVAPTQGLMSFKTGKLSLVLHDRTRMVDIAPFIKPDLFGSFGAEIAIEYGWSHIDGKVEDKNNKSPNYLGQFLENSRVTEKYIITNSSFSMDNTGQVNIELSIAMRGPVDIRSVKLHSDPMQGIKTDVVLRNEKTFLDNLNVINEAQSIGFKGKEIVVPVVDEEGNITSKKDDNGNDVAVTKIVNEARFLPIRENLVSAINAETRFLTPETIKEAKLTTIKKIGANLTKETRRKFKNIKSVADVIKAFEALDPTPKSKDNFFLGGTKPLLYIENAQYKDWKAASDDDKKNLVFQKGALPNVQFFMKGVIDYLDSVYAAFVGNQDGVLAAENALIQKIMGGLDRIDPFINTELIKQQNRIIEQEDVKSGVSVESLSDIDYVTFGSFITGLIGTHLGAVGKFDEIQIVSYTCNENCGLFSNMNVSSLLIDKKLLRDFLAGIFEGGATFTLESIISQVINRFINTRTNICYGLDDFYKIDSKTGNVEAKFKADKQKREINARLSKIYRMLADPNLEIRGSQTKNLTDVRFVMPKVKFTFDTLTSRKSGFEKTISRISLFDQNDNPFGSINTIMKDIYDKDIVAAAAMLNKIRQKHKSSFVDPKTGKGKKPKKPKKEASKKSTEVRDNIHEIARHRFYKKSWSVIQDLIDRGVLVEISEGIYEITGQFKLQGLKNTFKEIMPSVTYGTQNSAIIEASVSTVNEAKLNTVYLTRSDRAADNKKLIQAKVGFSKDLPLRVLPSQATATIYGCPFVNFAQYMFLDFETGTTVDNAYAITGIKHDLSPGKFTTQLTLSYGDVYGKYENAARTVARTISDIIKPIPIGSSEKSNTIIISSYSKTGDKLGASRLVYDFEGKVELGSKTLVFNIDAVASRSNAVKITKESTDSYKMIIYLNEDVESEDHAQGKNVKISLALSRDTKMFNNVKVNVKNLKNILKAKPRQVQTTSIDHNILNKKVFNNFDNLDFIKNERLDEFLEKLAEKFIGLFLKINFEYKGLGTNLDPKELKPTVSIDWDLFDKSGISDLFNEYSDKSELLKIGLNSEYTKEITLLLKNNNIDTIKERPETVGDYGITGKTGKTRKKSPIKLYTKPESLNFTIAGLEMDLINGLAVVSEEKDKNKKTKYTEFSYEKVVIDWVTLLNNIVSIKDINLSEII